MADTSDIKRIRVVDWVDCDIFAYRAPKGGDFPRDDRHPIVAIEDDKAVVGYWNFTPHRRRVIESHKTWVAARWRRQGIAQRMWNFGVDGWDPRRIDVSIATWNGCALVARMKVELAGRVDVRACGTDWEPTLNRLVGEAALRTIVRLRSQQQPRPALEAVP